jgi:hypothetical protein
MFWIQDIIILYHHNTYFLLSPVCQSCLSDLYRKLTEHFRPELFDDSGYVKMTIAGTRVDKPHPYFVKYKRYVSYSPAFNFSLFISLACLFYILSDLSMRGRCGRDRMVVGFTTTYAISAYHHWCLMLWVRISIRTRCTTLCCKVCQWPTTGQWFSLGTLVSTTNKTDCHDITEILLKVALSTNKQRDLVMA